MRSNKRIAYRYENIEGTGPYISGDHELKNMFLPHQKGNYRPGLSQDFPFATLQEAISGEILSGCKSLAQLVVWFEDFHSKLKEKGYRVYKLLLKTDYLEGNSGKQVFFGDNSIISKSIVPDSALQKALTPYYMYFGKREKESMEEHSTRSHDIIDIPLWKKYWNRERHLGYFDHNTIVTCTKCPTKFTID